MPGDKAPGHLPRDKESETHLNDSDSILFERDALAYKIMEGDPQISYDIACKEALKIIKINRAEDK